MTRVELPKSFGDFIEFDEKPSDEVIKAAEKTIKRKVLREMIESGVDLNDYVYDTVIHMPPEYTTLLTVGFKAAFKKDKWTDEQKQALAEHRLEIHRMWKESHGIE